MKDSNSLSEEERHRRRVFGSHMTSIDIFTDFIYPEIKEKLNKYIWVDLYAGEGNLILPILNYINRENREVFFRNNIYMFDIQKKMVQNCIRNAQSYGISESIAKANIQLRNNLENFPKFLKTLNKPIYHITNPPYLYLGYISKHESTKTFLRYFKGENSGYQDLYQIAMINDLRNNIKDLIYIIPTNFLYGASVSNKFRIDFLKYYNIGKMIIFETKKFRFTGTNICIGYFKRKVKPNHSMCRFIGMKIYSNNQISKKKYNLNPNFKYRAGSDFDIFLKKFSTEDKLKVKYYLLAEEINSNLGNRIVTLLDANQYNNCEYEKVTFSVNLDLYNKLISNILYVRTVDTGSTEGRVGLSYIKEDFNVDGIFVSGNTYRTHPIHVFLHPELSINKQQLLRKYFNFILEFFRDKLESEFLTTYKYSNASYTRKYLGLSQVRKIIETFPISMSESEEKDLNKIIDNKKFAELMHFLEKLRMKFKD
ncbi:MAG: SAM-dependent DNA methyltransferase [Candidatus Lokiarchaeota archaeon]